MFTQVINVAEVILIHEDNVTITSDIGLGPYCHRITNQVIRTTQRYVMCVCYKDTSEHCLDKYK